MLEVSLYALLASCCALLTSLGVDQDVLWARIASLS